MSDNTLLLHLAYYHSLPRVILTSVIELTTPSQKTFDLSTKGD